jgi:four helix bundle protein
VHGKSRQKLNKAGDPDILFPIGSTPFFSARRARGPFFIMGNFEKLKVWQRARDLAVHIYKLTAKGKFAGDFGLRDQMRPAAVSIPSNIAEGDEYSSDKQAIRFFRVAKGSAAELLTQTVISKEIDYIGEQDFRYISEECKGISAMLVKLIRARSQP